MFVFCSWEVGVGLLCARKALVVDVITIGASWVIGECCKGLENQR